MTRIDGRTGSSSLRELSLSTSILSRADGSAKFSSGPVSVLASVSGPIEVRLRDEIVDRATLEINIRPSRGLSGPGTKSLADSLSYILLPLLLLNRHPRSLIQLSLQTLTLPTTKFSKPFRSFSDATQLDPSQNTRTSGTDDGSNAMERDSVVEKATLINAAVCALMDAAIGMRGLAVAAGVAIVSASRTEEDDDTEEGMETDGSSSWDVVLDPTCEEERDAICTICIGFSFGQGVGGTDGELCFLEMGSGSCTEEQLSQATQLGRSASQRILAFIRKSQEARYLPQR